MQMVNTKYRTYTVHCTDNIGIILKLAHNIRPNVQHSFGELAQAFGFG